MKNVENGYNRMKPAFYPRQHSEDVSMDRRGQIRWDLDKDREADPLKTYNATSASPKIEQKVFGMDIIGLVSAAVSFKEEWVGYFGSFIVPDQEQHGQVVIACIVAAAYMLVKMFVGSNGALVISIGLFFAGGNLTKHPKRTRADDADNRTIELDSTHLSHAGIQSRNKKSVNDSLSFPSKRHMSVMEEAVEELRRAHQSSGLSSSRTGRTVSAILENEMNRRKIASAQGNASSQIEDDCLAEEFAHHHKPKLPPRAMNDDAMTADDEVTPRMRRAAAASARRERKKRSMRVQIKPRAGELNPDNIILR